MNNAKNQLQPLTETEAAQTEGGLTCVQLYTITGAAVGAELGGPLGAWAGGILGDAVGQRLCTMF
jgi:hypothetical protein